MDDLISREKVKEILRTEWVKLFPMELDPYLSLAMEKIENIPSAEPRKGKWVDIVEMDSGGYPFKVGVCCSACGFETLSEDNYCPHCGAKMKEVTE